MPSSPRSYDEIVRNTVLDPDGSRRPSTEQIEEADERFRLERLRGLMTDQERVLYARVSQELFSLPLDGEVGFEVDRGTVTLHGTVRDSRMLYRIEEQVRAIEGVDHVINRLIVQ